MRGEAREFYVNLNPQLQAGGIQLSRPEELVEEENGE